MKLLKHNSAPTAPALRSPARLTPHHSLLATLAVAVAALLLLAPSASAAAPSPQWQLTIDTQPTNFAFGVYGGAGAADGEGAYYIDAQNVGDAPASGAITLADALPAGLRVIHVLSKGPGASPGTCTPAPLQCVYSTHPVLPGAGIQMLVQVAVRSGATGIQINSASVSGGGSPLATATVANPIDPTPPPFGFHSLAVSAAARDGAPYTQAAGHPYQLTVSFSFNTTFSPESNAGGESVALPLEEAAHLTTDSPPGLIDNPTAVPQCALAEFWTFTCPASSQVGLIRIGINPSAAESPPYASLWEPVYNISPVFGDAADLGYFVGPAPSLLSVSLRAGGDYGFRTVQPLPSVDVKYAMLTLWGVPADPRHDPLRGASCSQLDPPVSEIGCTGGDLSSAAEELPFLTLPTACPASPLSATIFSDSWENPGTFQGLGASFPAPDGCEAVPFEPSIQARPTTDHADSPSGLDVDFHIPRAGLEEPEGRASSDLKGAVIKLPEGLELNPSSANGLAACTEAQVGYKPATAAPLEFTPGPAECPDASKLGSVEVDTPLLKNPLPGSVYLAQPHQNPFGSLLALYVVVDDPNSGIIVKLAGKVTPDPQTGQLTTSFEENPQTPFEDLHLHFFPGAQGALRTPATCGTFTTTSQLTPWSAPEAPATPSDEFAITGPASGSGTCPQAASAEPNAPVFLAGTETPQAGIYSPFSLKLLRRDGEQELKGIETSLPPGLIGKLAGISYCPEAALGAAAGKSAAAEQAGPSCPASSEVGSVDIASGAGPTPLNVPGHAYLAGPYKGAPLSLAIITPALAGPFDLGTVVVRVALYVNPETTQITAKSDPIPAILQGIPLDVRSITLKMARPNFTLNPTNCEPLAVTGSALSILNLAAPLTQRFQVGGCPALPFNPSLKLSLKGGTKRSQNPAFTAVLTAKPGEANIASAQVTLPHAEFLDQAHINTVCTRVQFAANQCPAASIYGHATAITPLLDQPLSGPVYLRSSSNKLPDLVAALNGQINVDLDGKLDTGKSGGIRNTFEVVPDAPVAKFTLEMEGGSKGLLVNSENLCSPKTKTHAMVNLTGQNGKTHDTTPAVANSCKKHRAHKHRGARR